MEELLYAVIAHLTSFFFPVIDKAMLKAWLTWVIICCIFVLYSIRLQSNFALKNGICV